METTCTVLSVVSSLMFYGYTTTVPGILFYMYWYRMSCRAAREVSEVKPRCE